MPAKPKNRNKEKSKLDKLRAIKLSKIDSKLLSKVAKKTS